MNEQNIACAELDGYFIEQRQTCKVWRNFDESKDVRPPPDYNSLDALHPLVCGLSDGDFTTYWFNLVKIIYGGVSNEQLEWDGCANILKATPAQVREALLKATGKWKEGGE